MNVAIILASGQGKRMGAGKNKVLLQLRRKPLIYHTINCFEKASQIDQIVVVCKKDEQPWFEKICQQYRFKKISAFVEGGQERQDSAYNALVYLNATIKGNQHIVLFHNGANPFVTEKEISNSIKEAKKFGASVAAHPAKDTIKEVAENLLVTKTLERKKLWNMQTPQTIKFDLACQAFEKAKEENFVGTDDVSLVERLGKDVKIVEASPYNFKITTPLDLELAKIILKKKYV